MSIELPELSCSTCTGEKVKSALVPPPTEEGPQSARLRELANIMGELRNTFYGLLWDVRSKAGARNIAYTNLDLGLHMDLLYFQNPPRFQFLHMLRNKVRGGASIFVDSFKVVERTA